VTSLDSVCAELSSRAIPTESGPDYLIAQCSHATLAAAMTAASIACDALIVDAPYSARTHNGHDGGMEDVNEAARQDVRDNVARYALGLSPMRRQIGYIAWTPADVAAFVGLWHPLTRGWIGSLTDTDLMHSWSAAMEEVYRYAFSPLACIESGSRFRAVGDGPPQWATWLCLSRPRSREWARWATIEARAARGALPLPGAYVGPSERKDVVGGKPAWLMRRIVADYSAPGDLVCDPCMGAGTTLVAAVELGRRAIGCEPDAGRFAIAARRLREARRPLPGIVRPAAEQSAMDLGGDR
jgi:hypothetical protein